MKKTVARIIYHNKTGWKTGKHTFVRGTASDLKAYAVKEARGREFEIQPLMPENIPPHFEPYIFDIG